MKKRAIIVLALAIIASMLVIMPCAYAQTAKTRDEAVAWASGRVGQYGYNMDAMYGAQCVDFIQEYYSFLGVSGGGGNAIDYASNALPAGFTRIANYIGFVPEPGDIGIWYGNNGNPYGHVAIVLSANMDNVTVADVWGGEANLGHNYVGYDSNVVHKITRPYYYSDTFCQGNFWGVIRPDFGSASSVNTVAVPEGECYLKNLDAYMSAYEDYNGGNVFASNTFDESIQKFKIYKSGNGYKIQSLYNNTNRVVNVWTTDYSKHGDNVTLYDYDDHPTQTWLFEPHGEGYIIHPADNMGLAITVQGNGNVAIENSTANPGQIWKIESPKQTISNNAQSGDDEIDNLQKNNIKLKYELVGDDEEAIGVKLTWSPSKNKYGYRIFRSETEGERGISISDFAVNGNEYVDVNIDSYTEYYYTVCPVEKEAKLNKKTGELTAEKLGSISEYITVTTPEIATETDSERQFILMEIGEETMLADGESVEIDPGRGTAPVIQSGRTLVPIRAIVEAMGGDVDWDEDERMISIEANKHTIYMWLGDKKIMVDGLWKTMDIAPSTINDRTMLPIRFVAENIGYQIEWIASSKQIVIVY